MKYFVSTIMFILLALALAWLSVVKSGGCNRDPVDDDPRPADCKPGDTKCMAGAPADPVPEIGGAL